MSEETNDTPEPETDAPNGLVEGKLQDVAIEDIDFENESLMFRSALRTGPLKKSLAERGLQIPVILLGRGPGRGQKYRIISGFRRCNAAREIGWTAISAIVRPSTFTEEQAFRASVLENTERKTYSDIDRAYVIHAYRQRDLGRTDIGALMGLTARQVNNIHSLLKIPEAAQKAVDDPDSRFTATHGLTLKKLSGKYADLDWSNWVARTMEEGLSVKQLAREVNKVHKRGSAVGFASIFNDKATDLEAGQIRLMPIKLRVSDLSVREKSSLKSELEKLISML